MCAAPPDRRVDGNHGPDRKTGQFFPDLDLFRRRLARRQCADHGASHPCGVAGLDRVRRRARLRRRGARSRPALRPGQPVRGQFQTQAGGRYRNLAGAGPRGHRPLRRQGGTVYPADVLGAERQRRRRAVRSGNHELVPVHLCGADAADHGLCDHAVAVPPADHGKRAGRLQGGLSLPEQFARADRSAGARASTIA